MDEMIQVTFTGGGPLDGEVQHHPRSSIPEDQAEWGTCMIVDGPRCHPEDPGARAVYEPDPAPADPAVWVWRGWVP